MPLMAGRRRLAALAWPGPRLEAAGLPKAPAALAAPLARVV
jgi:hypothetical protein